MTRHSAGVRDALTVATALAALAHASTANATEVAPYFETWACLLYTSPSPRDS